jgi:prepilin peptidase CpaA
MMLDLLVLGVFPGLVILAATSDMFTMTIPNRLCLALVAAFFVASPLAGLTLPEIGAHTLAALIALAATFALFATGVFGGGDAKLTAAVVLWLGPELAIDFALLAALLGGLITAVLVFGRYYAGWVTYIPQAQWAARLLSKEVGIPYGIALSAAAMHVFVQSPWFAHSIMP